MHAFISTILVLAAADIAYRLFLLATSVGNTRQPPSRTDEAVGVVVSLIFMMWAVILLTRA